MRAMRSGAADEDCNTIASYTTATFIRTVALIICVRQTRFHINTMLSYRTMWLPEAPRGYCSSVRGADEKASRGIPKKRKRNERTSPPHLPLLLLLLMMPQLPMLLLLLMLGCSIK